MSRLRNVEFRKLSTRENHVFLDRSRIIAVFVEIDDAFGLMVQDPQYVTREEKACLIKAARALPVRDTR